ncbi:hypothetical protein H0H87_012649, partial [Tephrocybe sp. NHM501043]
IPPTRKALKTRLKEAGQAVMLLLPTFIPLAFVDIWLIINTELTLKANRGLVGVGENEWTFGQILALFLLIIPVRDFYVVLMQIRDRRLKKIKRLSRESIGGSVASVEKLIRLDPGGYVKGEGIGTFVDHVFMSDRLRARTSGFERQA